MRTALGRGDCVDLVDDHRAHTLEHRARARAQHQIQALGRGDEDVRRVAPHPFALALGRVAGPDADADLGRKKAGPGGGVAQAGQRSVEVALDVVVERFQGRDVQDAFGGRAGQARGHDPVQRPQERRQRLARPGRREQQGVRAGGDRRPAGALGIGGFRERAGKPLRRHGMKRVQDRLVRHVLIVAPATGGVRGAGAVCASSGRRAARPSRRPGGARAPRRRSNRPDDAHDAEFTRRPSDPDPRATAVSCRPCATWGQRRRRRSRDARWDPPTARATTSRRTSSS